jgi:hypothetical protein
MKQYFFYLIIGVAVIFSCNPDKSFNTDGEAMLEFSKDTLQFDTVFTERGSATRILKIYNRYDKRINISKIMIADAPNSVFRLNVDGIPGAVATDVEIPANDSIYIFGEVTIDPDQPVSSSPFVINDEIIFETNGNTQRITLEAWGQNAVYIPNRFSADSLSLLSCSGGERVWDDEKPYVIFGALFIDNCTLKLPAGTRIHLHGGFARLEDDEGNVTTYNDGLIYLLANGKLLIEGTVDEPVIIQGDRLEEEFQDVAGQWAGIRISTGSTGNVFEHVTVKNSIVGVRVDSAAQVAFKNAQIYSTTGSGLIGVHANITAENSLFHSSSGNCVQLEYGGDYDFKYCTLASYGVDASALRMTNLLCLDQLCTQYRANNLTADFKNSIVFGSRKDEISLFKADEANFNYNFQNCVVRVDELDDEPPFDDFFSNCDPCINGDNNTVLFADVDEDDYRLDTLSVAEEQAMPISILKDLAGFDRDGTNPDIGCYEYQYE